MRILTQLNDPFDCRVDIKQSVANAISRLSDKKKENLIKIAGLDGYLDKIQKDTGNAGICSFSLELKNTLLWSHYAREHKGLCLTYNFPESFLEDTSNEITGAVPVEYGTNPLTDWFIENTPVNGKPDFEEFTHGVIKKVLTIKSCCWDYEKEIRIIRKKRSTLDIPRDFLRQVCFGMNTVDSDIDLIRKLVDSSGYKVAYCKIERSQNDFGIQTKEI